MLIGEHCSVHRMRWGSRQLTRGLFKEAHGAVAFRPKHHYAFHLPLQLYRHGFLVAAMTMERKHR
eukprot:2733621-Pyramimonas_sp.AAC.1